jgi:hypothetical protein
MTQLWHSRVTLEAEMVYASPADLSETERLLEAGGVPGSWTQDGTLIYSSMKDRDDRDIWTLPVNGDPVSFLVTSANERAPRLSPNGKWLAYISDQFGEDRVLVQAFPEGGAVHSVSTGAGTEAVWSRDGRELFYRNGNQMWVVEVETEPEFSAGRSELLFEAPYVLNNLGIPTYDVSLDGEQFLMVQQDFTADETSPLIVVEHWSEELTRLVPTN